jgi:endonuclease/exonuclease/phosphatase family metal-dependent hydrolase
VVKKESIKPKQPIRNTLRIALMLFTGVCYLSVLVSPGFFWLFGFLALTIPILLALHFILLLLTIPHFGRPFFLHLAALAAGIMFINATISYNCDSEGGELKVLSYNVRVFNNYSTLRNKDYTTSKKMINWSVNNDAQIKCFQEYYNNDKSEVFNVKNKLIKAGWKYTHEKIVLRDRARAEFGLAIFSKYKIVKNGEVKGKKGEFLNTIYADVLKGKDTVRIYCAHLESMAINEENVVNTERLAKSYKDTGWRLRSGFVARSAQVQALVENITNCPYKIILCGDLNELPYSYAYFSLHRKLENAFEEAGQGFGFSYNGKLFFLRIDNQFFSDDFKIHAFNTHREVNYSDHFPLTASYSWEPGK